MMSINYKNMLHTVFSSERNGNYKVKSPLLLVILNMMCFVAICQEKKTTSTYISKTVESFKDSTEFYTFPDSNGVRRIYHENGNVYCEGNFKKIKKRLNLTINVCHGLWNIYYTNGSLASSGKYYNGKKDLIWVYYTEDKKLARIESYNRGKLIDKRIYINESFSTDSTINIKGIWLAD